jgi:hypothetical protein
LLLYGHATVTCDVSNAHWNFLPLILAKRLYYVSGAPGRQTYINNGWREHKSACHPPEATVISTGHGVPIRRTTKSEMRRRTF